MDEASNTLKKFWFSHCIPGISNSIHLHKS
jgi:hypothetical protein